MVGHAISTIRTDSHLGFVLYAYIYLVHMPAMMLISGVFMKPKLNTKTVKQVVQLLSVWLTWEVLWAGIRWLTVGKTLSSSWLVSPAWTLWFLVSLATMRILLPYIARLKHPLLFSIVVALLAGASPVIGTQFSASRTLCFLPFFVAGWLAQHRGWFQAEWFMHPTRNLRAGAWALLIGVAAVITFIPHLQQVWRIDKWLTWRDDYLTQFSQAPIGQLQPDTWLLATLAGAPVRLLLIGVAFAMCFAFLIVISRKPGRATVWGTRTLAVYLLHSPIVFALRETGLVNTIGEWSLLAVVLIGVALALLLSWEGFTKLFRPLIQPRHRWLWSEEPQRTPTPTR